MEENSSSVEVLGKKNQIGTHRFKNPLSVEKKNQWIKGLLVCSFHILHLPTISPSCPNGFRKVSNYLGYSDVVYELYCKRDLVSTLQSTGKPPVFTWDSAYEMTDLIQNYGTCKIFSEMLNSILVENKTYLTIC